MHPLVILGVGIASILGLILVLRVHAFLALIVSAMVVSLLAPGPVEEKIQRVAVAFGNSAASIAIVIALAAIIGECMLASGAADRIVQAFLNLLGEKRSPLALMGSGFVLAVPVFFDTVFYLLVPLARSLFRRTKRNYLLYIMAIAAGGAITHTLVPPTPGPLVMASTLGVDIGVMILVGGLVALPAGVAGLAVAHWLDRTLHVPYRDETMTPVDLDALSNEDGTSPETGPTHTSPPLWLSLLPVILPVLLISTNTALSTAANSEHAARLSPSDVRDWDQFRAILSDAESVSPAGRVRELVIDWNPEAESVDQLSVNELQEAFNAILMQKSPRLYEPRAFEPVVRPLWKIDAELAAEPTDAERSRLERERLLKTLMPADFDALQVHQRERFNRTLLEVAFPELIVPHQWETPLRRSANVAALFGNANLALLFSAFVAMFLLYRQQRPTLGELSKTVEGSLMSGGTIILITAGGGAFGAMLQAAQIGPAIEGSFTGAEGVKGMMYLAMGYGVAALLKVAQGSSTVAMITASGILAAMVGGAELGFHPVYLATAIGAGSLMGSWMNDSGFWIFAKMGRLTELESLRSWTLMLVVLSLVSLAMTVLLAVLLPLTQ